MAAQQAAIQAAAAERLRCLWVLDRLVQTCQQDLEKKLLSAMELHAVKVRMEITKMVVHAAKALIASGVRPQTAKITPAEGNDKPPEESKVIVP